VATNSNTGLSNSDWGRSPPDLALLTDHAGTEAKIEIAPDWKDPVPDAANE